VLPGLDNAPSADLAALAPKSSDSWFAPTPAQAPDAPAQSSSLDMPDLGDVFAAAPPLPEPVSEPALTPAPVVEAASRPQEAATEEERIYELSEFDGVPVGDETDAERIFDLTEFGAERVA
jgi:hypothetical protein